MFEDYANTIVGNDDVKNEFAVMANTVDGLYESLRPDIFKMDFEPAYKDAILYLKGIIDGKIRPEKIEAAQVRINELLDQSVITAADARKYTIAEAKHYQDLNSLTPDALRDMVSAIYVDAPDKSSGKRQQKIEIYYDGAGFIPLNLLMQRETA